MYVNSIYYNIHDAFKSSMVWNNVVIANVRNTRYKYEQYKYEDACKKEKGIRGWIKQRRS